ncbi:unnamed protein product [Prunus armeniaca]|uniref:Uncharacterized protein n=1 Tax=Prunus armeniaca TaxID=36596 RepID=A0A6J5W2X6_PRUAR|nr:unnamed protein product [Prunus armeniaca]
MLDREKQAKKQQDAEYEGARGRANNQLKSPLNHMLLPMTRIVCTLEY